MAKLSLISQHELEISKDWKASFVENWDSYKNYKDVDIFIQIYHLLSLWNQYSNIKIPSKRIFVSSKMNELDDIDKISSRELSNFWYELLRIPVTTENLPESPVLSKDWIDTLTDIDEEISVAKETQGTETIDNIYELFRKHKWKDVSDILSEIVYYLEQNVLTNKIYDLIKVSMSKEFENDDVLINEVIHTTSTYFKEIKTLHDVGLNDEAIKLSKRCKEYLEFAQLVSNMRDEEGIPPLKTSSLVKVDEIDGRSIFAVED